MTPFERPKDNRRNEIARNDKKNIYTNKSSRELSRKSMKNNNRNNCYRPQTINIWPIMRWLDGRKNQGRHWSKRFKTKKSL